jgi:DNA-binding LacI/PurR family transcriptional regulator
MKEKSSTTIRDVARLANVSIGTVSRVLNDDPAVTEKTRCKVKDAIDELDYIPNPIARQLSIGRTLTIGIIQPYITLPSYIERMHGVQHILADSEYDLVIFNVDNPSQRNAYFKDLSYKMRADGIIIVSLPPNDEQAEYFAKSRIPIVFIDAYHPKMFCVIADDVEGGRIATRHLVELGHRKIAFLSDHLESPFHPSMRHRYLGYREVLEEAGILYNPSYVIEGERGRTNAQVMAKQLFDLDDPPTAIFAASDTHAFGVLDAARMVGLKVPERLSVIGYDNISDSAYNNLTTIDQSLQDSGAKAAQMLLELLGDLAKPPDKQFVALNLLVRKTTAPPPPV